MLRFHVDSGSQLCDGISRRELLRVGALSFGGLTLPQLLAPHSASAESSAAPSSTSAKRPRAKSVVVLYLSGGPSQLDSFDLKPDAPEQIRGTFNPVPTSVPGIDICEHFPRMARVAQHYTIIRSMSHDEGDHLKGSFLAWTGGRMQRAIVQHTGMSRGDRPHVGSALHKILGASPTMPPFVMVPEFVSPVGVPRPGQHAGFLGAQFDPYLINSDPNLPDYTPGPLRPPGDVPAVRIENRRSLLAHVSHAASFLDSAAATTDLDPYLTKAFSLVSSNSAQRAFNLEEESEATRNRYGRHVFGQSALVARRLIEAGVRLVQVNFVRHDRGKGGQGYDSHSVPPSPAHLPWCQHELFPPTDRAFASLVEDLADRGLLDETIVVMTGEFGRTPRFNSNGGRDHWPQCYCAVVAGGGFHAGQVFGSSDKIAGAPTSNPVSPEQLAATIYHQLGVDPQTEIHDMQHRPYRLVEAQPLLPLVS